MKQKIFFMLAIICCISFFSAAKQNNNKCNRHFYKTEGKTKCVKQTKEVTEYDVSPMRFLLFAI